MQISILGCGWLGLPLAKFFIRKGYDVNGSTTDPGKLPALKSHHINSFLIHVKDNSITGDVVEFLKGNILILNFPPKRQPKAEKHFVNQIKQLIPHVENSSIGKVIFISSTSVYQNNNGIVDETIDPKPEKESGKALLKVENILLSNPGFQTTIIRMAGLIGLDRHPGRFLASKKGLSGAENPVNLIHLDDCIGIIDSVIEKNVWGEIFNGCYPHHYPKQEYYSKAARDLGLSEPEFDRSKKAGYKIVDGTKVERLLGFIYKTGIL